MKEEWAESAKNRRKRPSVFRRTSLRVDLSMGAPAAIVDFSPAVSIASSVMVAPSPSSSSIGARSASHDEFAGFDDPIETEESVVLPPASVQPEASQMVESHLESVNTVQPARSESIEHPHQPVVDEIQHQVAVAAVVAEEVVAPVAPVESIQAEVDVPAAQPVQEHVAEQIVQPQPGPPAPVEVIPVIESVEVSQKVNETARSSSVSVSTPPQTPPTAANIDSPIVPTQSLAPATPPAEAAPAPPLSPPPVPPPPPPPSSQPKRTSIINPAFPLIPPVSPTAASVTESVAPSSPAPASAPPAPPKVPALPKRALPKLPPT
jgi:hypothetical protein